MNFLVTEYPQNKPLKTEPDESYPFIVLMEDNWNDFGYKTLCKVYFCASPNSEPQSIGTIRVMYLGQAEKKWVFREGPKRFSKLKKDFCSLATNIEFYKELEKVAEGMSVDYLVAMRDAAYSTKIWKLFSEDPCFQTSLLRDRSIATELRDTVPVLFKGRRKRYVNSFNFFTQLTGADNQLQIFFDFKRKKSPILPNRVMLLVGINGAGKTQLLSQLAITLNGFVSPEDGSKSKELTEKRKDSGRVDPAPSFYSVVTISFNAFDKFEIPDNEQGAKYSYTYCGIRRDAKTLYSESDIISNIENTLSSFDESQRDVFLKSFANILGAEKAKKFFDDNVLERYQEMSAGQRIVLNVLSHLIVNLKKRTLVLIDEPETHLHPSLTTSLVSEIFSLLDQFNSFAIIATHSPLIAQQVTSDSIRIISRHRNYVDISLPDIECFGGSLSDISNSLFEVREYERDYTNTIDRLLKVNDNNAAAVESLFSNGLGSNARIYLWATSKEKK